MTNFYYVKALGKFNNFSKVNWDVIRNLLYQVGVIFMRTWAQHNVKKVVNIGHMAWPTS
jgi:hypothetical protein